MSKLDNARFTVEQSLAELSDLFVPGAKLTFIMRVPGNNEADMLITNDDLGELDDVIYRSMARATMGES